jgi:lambda repressor-like predicted transcriptional regulator
VGAYSNPCDQVKRLQSLLELPRANGSRVPKSAAKQDQKRLAPDEVAQLVGAHQAGSGVKELAREFGVHRVTVSNGLRREGALRAPGIQPDDLPEVVRLHEDGWSLARLGEKFQVAPDTVGRALRAHGVMIRRPGGGSRGPAGSPTGGPLLMARSTLTWRPRPVATGVSMVGATSAAGPGVSPWSLAGWYR